MSEQISIPHCIRGVVIERRANGSTRVHHTARMYHRRVFAFHAAWRLARFLGVPLRPETLAVTPAFEIAGLVSDGVTS